MISIAIDGPAGAGKSTVAKAAAKALGYIYVDTGALYRAIGLFAHQHDIDPADGAALSARLQDISVELVHRNGEQRVLLGGEDVTETLRTPEMGVAASKVSVLPEVRAFLLEMQREMAKRYNVIMDGRDIGTVVLPDADVKIYLTASAQSRAERRRGEYLEKGQDIPLDEILEEIRRRDDSDMHRAISPLRQAEDAVLADTSALNLEQSIALVLDLIKGGIN